MNRGFGLCAGVVAWMAAFHGVGHAADVAALPGVIASFITAGTPDPNGKVPAIDAVSGAGVRNIAIATPLALLEHGHPYTVVLASQNNTFKGTCVDSYVLKRGTTVLASGKIHTYACQAGTYWEWAVNTAAIPNKPGLATLAGTVTYGGKTATTTATVLIQ